MRTTSVVEPHHPAPPASSLNPPQTAAGFQRGPLIVTGLVGFWLLLLLVNLVALPVRLVRRLLRR